MKKSLMLVVAVLLVASSASAVVLVNETFSYADGSLVPNGGWATHSGTPGDLLVASGQAVVQHGVPSEDANIAFTPTAGGDLFYSFDFSVDDLGAPYSGGTDFEYFAHFAVGATSGFSARMDIVAPNGSGDYTVGIGSTSSTADATWPGDLTFGVTYHVVVRYNQDTNISELWIDSSAITGLSILGADESDPGNAITRFALRQSDSSENETVRVDNLIVGDACEDVFTTCLPVATDMKTWGDLKSIYR